MARDIVNYMLLKRPDIRAVIVARKSRLLVMDQTEGETDLPERRDWKKPAIDDRRLTPGERANYNEPGGIASKTDKEYWDGRATTATTAPSSPADFEVSTETIDFGGDATVNQFEIANSGGSPGTWQVAVSSQAISLSSDEGELAAGETATVEMSLDREGIEEGDIEETITLSWDGGEVELAVVGSHEDLPVIHNPQASPASVEVSGDAECTNDRTTISARVRDTSPLESVVVRWSPDGGAQQETAMESVGNDMFEAVIGPFTTVQTAEARIVAFDDRGNAGGASASVTVNACP
jgi:hypothetical protein